MEASQATMQDYMEKFIAAYRNAPFTKTVTGEITLSRTPEGNWESEQPFAILQPIVENLDMLPAQAESGSLTPQQVTDILLKAFVSGDMESASKLTDYYRAEKGENAREIEQITQEFTTNFPSIMLQQWEAGPGQQMPELKPQASEFFTNMFASVQRSQCQTTKGKAATADDESVVVQYRCKVANLDKARKQFQDMDIGELNTNKAAMKNFLEKAAAAYRDAPFTKTITGEITLSRTPEGNWEIEQPHGVLQPILENLNLFP
jgi:hypothetical protein